MARAHFHDVVSLRHAFPITQHCAYLNHAAIAPLPTPVCEAIEDYLVDRAGGQDAQRYEHLSDDLRDALARLISARPNEIAFVQNTSEGLNLAANALPLEPGDNVIFCDMEFPSNVYPWMHLTRRGVEARCIPHDGGGLTVEALEAHTYDLTFLPGARRFELGCANFIGQVGLLAAVRFLLDVGIETIERWVLHLTDLLIADLHSRGYTVASNLEPEHRSAIASFSVPGDVGAAYEQLTAAGIVLSRREDYIRVSPHCYNTEEEILRVGNALQDTQ